MLVKFLQTLSFLLMLSFVSMGACSKGEKISPLKTSALEHSEVKPPTVKVKTAKTQDLPEGIFNNAESVQPLQVGSLPPHFSVRSADGNLIVVKPSELLKPVVLTFFRGGWCPYCNRHLAEMRTVEANLKNLGFDVWFMSIDKPELLYESLSEPDIGYTLYSDSELEATKAFGIGFIVDDATHEKYLGYGIDLSNASGFDHHVLPAPSTFILGEGGRVHFQYTNPDYTVRLAPTELLAAASSYIESHRD